MELPKFKLSLSGIYSKKETSSSVTYDENADTKQPLSERKGMRPLLELRQPCTQVNTSSEQASPERKPDAFPALRISSQPTDLMLLHLESSKGEESILTIEDNSMSLDNQDFYTQNCAKRRMISRLDMPAERKMSQTLTEFMKTSTEIKKELKGKQLTDADKSLFEGSLAQALSPHFPNGAPSHFAKEVDEDLPDKLLEAANDCLVKAGIKPVDETQAANPRLLLELLVQALSTPARIPPLVFSREVTVSPEDTEIFQQFFGRKAVQDSASEQALLRVISFYHAQVLARDEEVKEIQRELKNKVHALKTLDQELKKTTKLFRDKTTLLDKTIAELRTEIVEMKVACDRLREENDQLLSEKKRARSRSPIHSSSQGEAQAVLGEICRILSIKHQHHVLKSVAKLEKVVRAVPRLERFIREVHTFLFPGLKDENLRREYNSDTEFLSRKLKEWVSELNSLRAFKASVSHFLNVDNETSNEDLLQLLGLRAAAVEGEFAQHFRQVFELSEDDNLFEAASQVFLQSHELRSFCRKVKEHLGVSEESSLSSLLLLVKQLKRR